MKFVVILVLFGLYFGVSVVMVKLAVELVGGKHKSWFSCIMATLCVGFAQWGFGSFFGVGGLMVALLVAGAVYMATLGTTFFKGVIIALIQAVLVFVTFLVLSSFGILLTRGSFNIISGRGS
jgi:hypothetical protein